MPLNKKDATSNSGEVYNNLKKRQTEDFPLVHLQFSQGEVLRHNLGNEVSLSKLTQDDPSSGFTGKEQGFFKKFGSNELVK